MALYHLHDSPNIHTKSNSNRSRNFEDYLANKNADRQQTDRQTDGNILKGHGRSRKHESACKSTDELDYSTFLAYARESKMFWIFSIQKRHKTINTKCFLIKIMCIRIEDEKVGSPFSSVSTFLRQVISETAEPIIIVKFYTQFRNIL